MRWSCAASISPPPGGRPPQPWTIRLSSPRLDFDAAGCEARRDRAEPVALLDAQLGEAGKARRAARAGGGDREDRVLVDHARRAPGGHLDAGERPALDREPGHRLAAVVGGGADLERGAHLLQAVEQAGAQRD